MVVETSRWPSQQTRAFDIYVGASAGSVVASLLGVGVPARELWRTVLGHSTLLPPIGPKDIFRTETPYLKHRL